MFAYCGNNPVNSVDNSGTFAIGVLDYFPVCFGQAEIMQANHPKDSPPNHPDFESPKKGNLKKRNPNGQGYGWVDNKGNVWVWTPNMHGGPGWTVQSPDGGHSHAYPGGGTRVHFDALPEQSILLDYPSRPRCDVNSCLQLIPPIILAGVIFCIAYEVICEVCYA